MDQQLALSKNNRPKGFTLIEVVVSLVLVGMVLAMIGGAVFMLDSSVGNERIVTLPASVSASDLEDYGYSPVPGQSNPTPPTYTMAPSRFMDAKAEALWRQVQELYMQSYAVSAVADYVLNDFTTPKFLGSSGYLSSALDTPLLAVTLADPATMHAAMVERFGGSVNSNLYEVWSLPSSIDSNSYRAATIFFLAEQDRLLGMLRVRAFQFNANQNDPYRYYEASLTRLAWEDTDISSLETWVLRNDIPNFVEDFSYRFVEDKRYPQTMVIPFSSTQEIACESGGAWPSSKTNNFFMRAAIPGEVMSGNGISRYQTSFSSPSWDLGCEVNEWHVILPDPGLGQSEKRAKILRNTPRTDSNFNAILYNSIVRQGRFACVFKVFP